MDGEKRQGKRRRLTGPVHYCCSNVDRRPPLIGELPDVGVILNQSDSGICFLSTCPLQVGQSLVVNCPWMSEKHQQGTVKWCTRAAADLWRVGFQKTH
jgi:hypothetical protein